MLLFSFQEQYLRSLHFCTTHGFPPLQPVECELSHLIACEASNPFCLLQGVSDGVSRRENYHGTHTAFPDEFFHAHQPT